MIIESQAVLGQFPDAPESLLVSLDADVFPRYAPDKSDLIEGAIGELSMFHETYGYYAHGIDHTTAMLPSGWADRLVRVSNENTAGAVGLVSRRPRSSSVEARRRPGQGPTHAARCPRAGRRG